MTHPRVTIGLPTVNEPFDQVALAVRSVFAQSIDDWELVVLCDGSPDELVQRLQQIDDERVTVVRTAVSRGIAYSLNQLADHARGDFIAILAADDMWTPDRLSIQLPTLERPDAPDVVAAQMVVIDSDSLVVGGQRTARLPDHPEGWVADTPISHATAMATTQWFREHRYDESLLRAQDRAFWIDAHVDSRIEVLDSRVYYYRVPLRVSYRKYAVSSRYARHVIWAYGRKICSVPVVIRLYVRALLKQAVLSVLYWSGGTAKLYYRRIEPMPISERRSHEGALASIANTRVPGWD